MFGKKQVFIIAALMTAVLVALAVVLLTLPKAPPADVPSSAGVNVSETSSATSTTATTEKLTDYPLKLKESGKATFTKITRPEWDLSYDVYYYGVTSVEVTVGGKQMDLIKAVNSGALTFDELVNDAKKQIYKQQAFNTTARDGGSWLCRFEQYAILKMHTLSGDRSLFIGTTDLDLTAARKMRSEEQQVTTSATNTATSTASLRLIKNSSTEPVRMNKAANAWGTDDVIYYVGVDEVLVSTKYGDRDLMALVGRDTSFSFSEFLDNLTAEAGSKMRCRILDGRLEDGIGYSEMTLNFDNCRIVIANCNEWQEVYYCAPNISDRFAHGILDRIAEDMPKYPLTVMANSDPMPHKITKAAWGLDYDVYYGRIDRVAVTVDGKTIDLIAAIDTGVLTFDELVADAARLEEDGLIRVTTRRDGGSKEYLFHGYSILKMHSLNGDRSLYINSR